MKKQFASVAMNENNEKWEQAILRVIPLYTREHDIRSPFYRDYTRIIHSRGFRRLKHKTQVFYATDNDHICTRIEHVQHVEAVSNIICSYLGLNTALARAIALGHDIGHSPFGHAGEKQLSKLALQYCNHFVFWHEKNGLRFADYFETLPGPTGNKETLNLTYAVRDGIVCHCGEVVDQIMKPRVEALDLHSIQHPGETLPFSWEGCIVRIADKISYLGRDIEDAISLQILSEKQMQHLQDIYEQSTLPESGNTLNNTVLIHELIMDLCSNSTIEKGLRFSPMYYSLLQKLRAFSEKNIYEHPRLRTYKKYAELMITSIFEYLENEKKHIVTDIRKWKDTCPFPILSKYFARWLLSYSDIEKSSSIPFVKTKYVYTIPKDYELAIIEFISGMTDHFIMKIFDEMTRF